MLIVAMSVPNSENKTAMPKNMYEKWMETYWKMVVCIQWTHFVAAYIDLFGASKLWTSVHCCFYVIISLGNEQLKEQNKTLIENIKHREQWTFLKL